MPDLWIDHHVGDEARPRPEFKDALRSSLSTQLGRRRTPWRALGWAAATVLLVGLVATVVLTNRDHRDTIAPGPSGQALIDQVVDRTWYLATDNGVPAVSRPEFPASFELHRDGTYVGSDGCNDFGSTVDSRPKSGWTVDGTTLHITGTTDTTAVGCSFRTTMPLVDDTAMSLAADGVTLTLTDPSGRVYVATTLPPLTGTELAARLVGVRWTVSSVQDQLSPRVAWFEFHSDGTLSGFNGCVPYSGSEWSLVGNELTVGPVAMDQPLCTDQTDIVPFTGNTSRIAIDGLGRGLTITNHQVYSAIPTDTSDGSSTTTTSPMTFVLEVAVADRDWYVITVDGVMVNNNAWFRLHPDHTVTGNDGCQDYATDPASADGWSLNGRILAVPALTKPGTCLNVDSIMPLETSSVLSLDATGTRLTATGTHTYLLSTDPVRDRVEGKRWYVFVHNGLDVNVNAWFELHDDGSFSGFDGCNDYASSTDPSSPASGWKIENGVLRVFGTGEASVAGCTITPLMPVVDGMSLGFEESFNAIYMEGRAGQFTVTLTPVVNPDSTTTVAPEPVDTALSPHDRATLLAAALFDRARVHNSFGGQPLPVLDVRVVELVGSVGVDQSLDMSSGNLLTVEERAAITAAFAPHAVQFVAADATPYPSNDGDLPVLQVGNPIVIDGHLAVVSSLYCGSLCATGGGVTAVRHSDGSWTMGDPVGPQWVS